MEGSARIEVLCGNIWVAGKVVSLGNKTGAARVWEFGGRLVDTSVYPKFGHLYYALMGSVSKSLMGGFIIVFVYPDFDNWLNNVVHTIRFWLILLYNVCINVVKVVFVSGLDGESMALVVVEGAELEVFVGGTKEDVIQL